MIFSLAGDRAGLCARNRGQLPQDAVDPDAYIEPPLPRCEVDVRRAQLERLRERPVDEEHSGRVMVQVEHVRADPRSPAASVTTSSIILRRPGVEFGDRGSMASAVATQMPYGHADRQADLVGNDDVGRVGDGYRARSRRRGSESATRGTGARARGQEQCRGRVDRIAGRDRRTPARAALRGPVRRLGRHEALRHEHLAETPVRLQALQLQGVLELLGGDNAVANDQRTERRPLIPRMPGASMLGLSAGDGAVVEAYRLRAVSGPGTLFDAGRNPAGDQRLGQRGGAVVGAVGRGLSSCSASDAGTGWTTRIAWPARSRGCGSSSRARASSTVARGHRRRGAGRQPVHAPRRHQPSEGNPAGLLAGRRGPKRPSRCTWRSTRRYGGRASRRRDRHVRRANGGRAGQRRPSHDRARAVGGHRNHGRRGQPNVRAGDTAGDRVLRRDKDSH